MFRCSRSGGYGRKDLFPYSDIDVLFAFADEKTEEQTKDAVRAIIQGMWDIGLAPARVREPSRKLDRFDPDNLEFTLATARPPLSGRRSSLSTSSFIRQSFPAWF